MHVFKKHRSDCQKQHCNLGQSNSLHVQFATLVQLIYVFWIDGIPQLFVYHPHADKYILHSHPKSNDQSGKAR